jgi:hypothetical protein
MSTIPGKSLERELAEAVSEAMTDALAPLAARISALEDRPELRYCGVYESDRAYGAGNAVTCNGSVWIAKTATCQRPDEDGPGARDWTLAVKRGKDGKDLR